jgi:hypothetical protein
MIKSRRACVGHVQPMGEMRNTYRILVGMPEGMRSCVRPRLRYEDIIKMDLKERVWMWTGFIWLRIGTGGGPL